LLDENLFTLFAYGSALASQSELFLLLFAVLEVLNLLEIKLKHASLWNHYIAAIVITPSLGVAPLARHHTLEEAAAIVQLAAKDVYEVVNSTPTFDHEPLKVSEGNLRVGQFRALGSTPVKAAEASVALPWPLL
jgi:hypothetical protein